METDDIEEDDAFDREKAIELIGIIKNRCDEANIKYLDKSEDDDNDFDLDFTVKIPNGRDTRDIYLWDNEDLERFNSIDFEKYKLIGDYAAICSYEKGTIEAILSEPSAPKIPRARNRAIRILGMGKCSKNIEDIEITPENSNLDLKLRLKSVSKEAKILAQAPTPIGISIEISGLSISNQTQALEKLLKYSNSLFFEIDLNKGLHLSLLRRNKRQRNPVGEDIDLPVTFPRNSYDEAPMALYWYARSATNMPLLQFLAYYQSIEFYYPTFYHAEVSRKIRKLLKNPSFRIDRDADITKIVSTLRSRATFLGAERDQLKATLKECLDNDDMTAFLNSNEERGEFFSSKAKGITSHILNPSNKGTELYNQVADRIYDIRCKIVHVKGEEGDNEVELLLPFSKEAEKLDYDIQLLRYVAQKVMIYSSSDIGV